MTRHLLALSALALVCVACGDDTEVTATSAGSTSATTASAGGGGSASTSSAAGGATASSTSAGGMTGTGGGGGGTGGQGGSGFDCSTYTPPTGPISHTVFTTKLTDAEDIAFDGKGGLYGRTGNDILRIDSSDASTVYATVSGNSLGLRFMQNGNLMMTNGGAIREILPNGTVNEYVTGVSGSNGLFVDFDDNVWVTRFTPNTVIRIDSSQQITTIEQGNNADNANGIVKHPSLNLLYYTEYNDRILWRVDVSGNTFTPEQVATFPDGTRLDGLVFDQCDNIYVVDNDGDRLYRLSLNAAGAADGTPEEIASFSSSVANAQFGSGTGFNPESLYVAGFGDAVYEVPLGVPGAAIPTAP